MIPVMQTRDGWPHGNCWMAALASILEVPLESLPDLYEEGTRRGDPEAWWWGIALEVAEQHGVLLEHVSPGDGRYPGLGFPPGYAIACIPSPGVTGHAVVALDGAIVHDPHPRQPSRGLLARDVKHWYAVRRANADSRRAALTREPAPTPNSVSGSSSLGVGPERPQ
jgi:hypothetical protein